MAKVKPIIIGSAGNEAKRQDFSLEKGKEQWEGKIMETPQTPLEEDRGTGRAAVIRRFDFQLPPIPKDMKYPSTAELLNHHKGSILSIIWKDNLEQISDMNIVMKKKKGFSIFVTCKPRLGHTLIETPQTINQILTNGNRH